MNRNRRLNVSTSRPAPSSSVTASGAQPPVQVPGRSALRNRLGLVSLATVAVVAPAAGAWAGSGDEKPPASYLPWEKGAVTFGGFLAAFDSNVGFGVNNAAGISINAEEALGLDSSLSVWRAGIMYRPGESLRHQVDLTYARYHRDGTAVLSEDIYINGTPYPIGTQVESLFNFDILRGTYSYAILQDERMRIALGGGVYAVPLEYGLNLTTSGGRTAVDGAETTLPLPVLALRSEFQLVPRLFLNASIDAMYLEIESFSGSLLDVNVALEYRPWDHFGIGLGYNGMSVNVTSEDDSSRYPGANFIGAVDVRYTGLMLYAKWTF